MRPLFAEKAKYAGSVALLRYSFSGSLPRRCDALRRVSHTNFGPARPILSPQCHVNCVGDGGGGVRFYSLPVEGGVGWIFRLEKDSSSSSFPGGFAPPLASAATPRRPRRTRICRGRRTRSRSRRRPKLRQRRERKKKKRRLPGKTRLAVGAVRHASPRTTLSTASADRALHSLDFFFWCHKL
jgi:hypothetical protein